MASKLSIKVGYITVGGGAPVVIQTMTKVDTANTEKLLEQVNEIHRYGAEIVRIAVPTRDVIPSLREVLKNSPIPVIADVHFDPRIALEAIKAGVHGLRLNPGNISDREWIARIVAEARARHVPIRVGANSGSLPRDLYQKIERGKLSPAEGLVQAALRQVEILEDLNFRYLKISVKSSDPEVTYQAYKMLSKIVDYPLHLGVTEAGPVIPGTVKSTYTMIRLLKEGIGDTIRVSLTDSPVKEIEVAREILKLAGLYTGPQIISCPTCGRLQFEHEKFFKLVEMLNLELNSKFRGRRLKVAIMGCVVNGPGEARNTDLALVFGKDYALLYLKGEPKLRLELKGMELGNLVKLITEEVEKLVSEL